MKSRTDAVYGKDFYAYINRGSLESARVVVPIVKSMFSVSEILDVGCGAGAWLSVWKEHGCGVTGIDGEYVLDGGILIDRSEFVPHDLNDSFSLARKFDLVQCLEVAEHLPEVRADQLVESLTGHGDIVMFSAACPGQGGKCHINEQPYSYWKEKFGRSGFVMIDCLRRSIGSERQVKPWYRYNIFVFMSDDLFRSSYSHLESDHVVGAPKDVSPTIYQIRKAIVRLLPESVVTLLAEMVEKINVKWLAGSALR